MPCADTILWDWRNGGGTSIASPSASYYVKNEHRDSNYIKNLINISNDMNKLLVKEIQLFLNYGDMKNCSNDQILFSYTYNLFTLILW